jgi:hypothetical protein
LVALVLAALSLGGVMVMIALMMCSAASAAAAAVATSCYRPFPLLRLQAGSSMANVPLKRVHGVALVLTALFEKAAENLLLFLHVTCQARKPDGPHLHFCGSNCSHSL